MFIEQIGGAGHRFRVAGVGGPRALPHMVSSLLSFFLAVCPSFHVLCALLVPDAEQRVFDFRKGGLGVEVGCRDTFEPHLVK